MHSIENGGIIRFVCKNSKSIYKWRIYGNLALGCPTYRCVDLLTSYVLLYISCKLTTYPSFVMHEHISATPMYFCLSHIYSDFY